MLKRFRNTHSYTQLATVLCIDAMAGDAGSGTTDSLHFLLGEGAGAFVCNLLDLLDLLIDNLFQLRIDRQAVGARVVDPRAESQRICAERFRECGVL